MARTNLELVVLALLEEGLATPYDFRMTAGLSVGSTIPALKRLEHDGLITGSETGPRNSRRFTISGKGKKCLAQERADFLSDQSTDFDSIVRITFLAWRFWGTDAAADYLHYSGSRLRQLAGNKMVYEARLHRFDAKASSAEKFVALRTLAEANRLKADSSALETLSRQVRMAERKKVKRARTPSVPTN